ncbi:AAA family ATPase [Atopomonas hussainii]|uniref:AAA family ATPase n=1 Tax=Atopomonas hussainii TaxID=1429083 RepID=UPI00090043BA|nr:MoxR family ATPase [Atopomonas hussainii]
MKPSELVSYLSSIVVSEIKLSVMIWGAPGIGKSSIVKALCETHGLSFIDLRLSQLAPTDLRGLPVPKSDRSCWLPPDFFPSSGRGVLFLDEINLAPPAIQGVAQQLILDRRVGSYELPEGWFVWAAGNRKEDRSAVFDMPSPLANRFIHLDVSPSPEDFRQYAYRNEFDDRLISFITFREDLLHKMLVGENAWPSPRSWQMADVLMKAGLDISPAIGLGPAAECYAYIELTQEVPDLDKIVKGNSDVAFPKEPSLKYAATMGLVARCKEVSDVLNCFHWLIDNASAEWVQLFATDIFPLLRSRKQLEIVHEKLLSDAKLKEFLMDFTRLMSM